MLLVINFVSGLIVVFNENSAKEEENLFGHKETVKPLNLVVKDLNDYRDLFRKTKANCQQRGVIDCSSALWVREHDIFVEDRWLIADGLRVLGDLFDRVKDL